MVASPDFGHLEPMLTAAHTELRRAGVTAMPETVLADAGYWHQEQMERIVGNGTQVLIPPDSSRRKGIRPGWDGGLYAFMRRVLATDVGALPTGDNGSSSQSSRRPSSTAGWSASTDAADPPPGQNGA
jgi:hypothetical protein